MLKQAQLSSKVVSTAAGLRRRRRAAKARGRENSFGVGAGLDGEMERIARQHRLTIAPLHDCDLPMP
jgi:hypothetical protein